MYMSVAVPLSLRQGKQTLPFFWELLPFGSLIISHDLIRMRSVELVPGIRSSVLGFGCAPILGSVDGKTARRAIDCAVDCGVTHFDLARSYGYGEAESFVGNVLKSRRDQLVIASKFGIQANWKASLLKPLKPLVRLIRQNQQHSSSNAKSIQTGLTGVADRFHDRIPLRSKDMIRNVERSLRALQMDYLDYLFIHEPHEFLTHIDELVLASQQLKQEGKIRAFGLAFMNSQKSSHQSYLNQFDVLQFDNPPGLSNYKALVNDRGPFTNVLFSALKGGNPNLKPLDKLRQLSNDFPNSVILCSMFKEEHIKANCNIVQ